MNKYVVIRQDDVFRVVDKENVAAFQGTVTILIDENGDFTPRGEQVMLKSAPGVIAQLKTTAMERENRDLKAQLEEYWEQDSENVACDCDSCNCNNEEYDDEPPADPSLEERIAQLEVLVDQLYDERNPARRFIPTPPGACVGFPPPYPYPRHAPYPWDMGYQ